MALVQLIKPLVLAFLASFILTPLVIWVYKKLGWLDDPKTQTHPKVVHQYPVPRGGGVVIFLSILISGVWFLPLDKHLAGIILGALVLTIVGVVDDVKNLKFNKGMTGFDRRTKLSIQACRAA